MAKFNNATTILLGTFVIWACLILLITLTGLGARYRPLPTNASLAKPIPSVNIVRNTATLGPIGDYAEVGNRPLLMFDRRPGAVLAAPGDNSAAELDVSLGSVLLTNNLKMAIFRENQGGATRRVRLGELIENTGWRLVQLEPRRAVLEGPNGQRAFDLLVFDGKGGQSPTTVVVSQANADAAQAQNAEPAAGNTAKPAAAVGNTNSVALAPPSENMSQEQQIEAIRQRIAARRAQMQADAAKEAANAKK